MADIQRGKLVDTYLLQQFKNDFKNELLSGVPNVYYKGAITYTDLMKLSNNTKGDLYTVYNRVNSAGNFVDPFTHNSITYPAGTTATWNGQSWIFDEVPSEVEVPPACVCNTPFLTVINSEAKRDNVSHKFVETSIIDKNSDVWDENPHVRDGQGFSGLIALKVLYSDETGHTRASTDIIDCDRARSFTGKISSTCKVQIDYRQISFISEVTSGKYCHIKQVEFYALPGTPTFGLNGKVIDDEVMVSETDNDATFFLQWTGMDMLAQDSDLDEIFK